MWNVTPAATSTNRQYSHAPPARDTTNWRYASAGDIRYRVASGLTQTITGTASVGGLAVSLAENSASRFALAAISRSASATSASSIDRSPAAIVPSLFLSRSASSLRCLAAGNFLSLGGRRFFIVQFILSQPAPRQGGYAAF